MSTLEYILLVQVVATTLLIVLALLISRDVCNLARLISSRMGELIALTHKSSKAEGKLEEVREAKEKASKIPAPVVVVKNLDK